MGNIKKGKFIVIDGMDGAGKGVFLGTLREELRKDKKKVLDVNEFWEKNDKLPNLKDLKKYNAIYTSEPTHYGVGRFLRNILISNDSEIKYSTATIAQAYALDRNILYEGLILPFLKKGGLVFQSRSVSTSLVYQKITGEKDDFSFKDVLNLPGNQFALKYAPNYLIILKAEVEQISERLKKRKKDDNAIFEKTNFQRKVKKGFESAWFRRIFEKKGSKIIYMDASQTIDFSRQQMIDFYQKKLKNKFK